eukprot:TRINITY_DN11217_c0_g3_i1.p1 TRINITY_DN11217_c0_g3~~TRINITY_DN11217_c0_g3_i1.p1  ORF type:complete len:212 (+),score=25.96 TRINITY_DN11217_c0_g3_i1:246-881(+)
MSMSFCDKCKTWSMIFEPCACKKGGMPMSYHDPMTAFLSGSLASATGHPVHPHQAAAAASAGLYITTTDTSNVQSKWRKADWQARLQRLKAKGTTTLYHQTQPAAADAILKSGKFLRGSTGWFGGGIYFAQCIEDTHRKAHAHGVVLEADVYLGNRYKLVNPHRRYVFTFRQLLESGYDSVHASGIRSGDEMVVYNFDQIKKVRRAASNAT